MLHNSQLVTFPAHSAPPEQPSWGGKSKCSKLQTIVASLRRTSGSNQAKPTHAERASPPLIQATARVCIPTYTSTQVWVLGPFDSKGDWIVECLVATMTDT